MKLVVHLHRTGRGALIRFFGYPRVGLLSLAIFSLTFGLDAATMLKPQEVISSIDKAQQLREEKLAAYTVMEHYAVHNSHFANAAELTATVHYQKEIGKTYHVLSRKGPHFLEERVLYRILKEDAQLSRNSERSHTLLTSNNYSMDVQGTHLLRNKLCYVIGIHPRMHKFSLIEGTAWVDVQDFSLLRIEGRPAASPSFWTGRPLIEREYIVIDGLSFPHHSRATSKGFFAGQSQLDIDYSQYLLTLSP